MPRGGATAYGSSFVSLRLLQDLRVLALQSRPAELIISCGQHCLASNYITHKYIAATTVCLSLGQLRALTVQLAVQTTMNNTAARL